jgi:hypothetical protein
MTNDTVVPVSFGRAVWTVLWIGLIAGTLDITDNIIYNAFRGVTMKMIFQYIASGLIGTTSFQMGGASVALGVAIHYAIALTWTAIFYIASRQMPVLRERPVISGIVYGGIVYLIMNYAVLPLTRVPPLRRPVSVVGRVNAVLALLFCIGLTISLLVKWSDSRGVAR